MPNPSIERKCPGKPGHASHVKRYGACFAQGETIVADFRIIKITLNSGHIFIRRETVGKSTIGGDDAKPYSSTKVLRHFRNMVRIKVANGKTITPLDQHANRATTATVQVLFILSNTTESHADSIKSQEISNARAAHPNLVLNVIG
ncbi:hypothetical protein [Jeongeupia naejangsanensis]|uniref:Uncharacterized protein n=1 Tax=Jeongeupia naejangsanensis TaxID=613195 RepID=A0ABS2BKC8_9NEIS|nr:hypothetical protein [Jeongeupia naejangsanensis]MBM3116073.1 hypothetical protein [Jeongeupia naejangsanensis]